MAEPSLQPRNFRFLKYFLHVSSTLYSIRKWNIDRIGISALNVDLNLYINEVKKVLTM